MIAALAMMPAAPQHIGCPLCGACRRGRRLSRSPSVSPPTKGLEEEAEATQDVDYSLLVGNEASVVTMVKFVTSALVLLAAAAL